MRIKINGIEIEASEQDIHRLLNLSNVPKTSSPESDTRAEIVAASPVEESPQIEPKTGIQVHNAIKLLKEAGMTLQTLVLISRNILNVNTTTKLLESDFDRVENVASGWLNRQIKDTFVALFIGQIRTPSDKKAIAIVGLNPENKKVILAVEESDIYTAINRVKARGLRANSIKLIVLPIGQDLDDAVVKLFPNVRIQKDWNSVIATAPKLIRDDIKNLMTQTSPSQVFNLLKKSPAKEFLEPYIEELLTYLEFDRRLWHVLKTLACIDRLESEIRTKSKMADTPEETNLLVIWAALRLQYQWVKVPVDSAQLNSLRYLKDQADTGGQSVRVSTQKGNIRRRPAVSKER